MSGVCETTVELAWWRDRRESWIRFGQPVGERLHDRRRRAVVFAPGAVFALVRWAAGDYGTTASQIDILRAVAPGAPYTTRPDVFPGAEVLAAADGWTRVRKILLIVDAVEAAGVAPHAVAPAYWRHVHNRVQAGLEPRAYDRVRHRAWRLARKAGR